MNKQVYTLAMEVLEALDLKVDEAIAKAEELKLQQEFLKGLKVTLQDFCIRFQISIPDSKLGLKIKVLSCENEDIFLRLTAETLQALYSNYSYKIKNPGKVSSEYPEFKIKTSKSEENTKSLLEIPEEFLEKMLEYYNSVKN